MEYPGNEQNLEADSNHITSIVCQPVIFPLLAADVTEAARLYTEVFLNDEPTSHRHAPDPEFFLEHAIFYVGSLVKRDFSFLVRDKCTRELIGFIFCLDMAEDIRKEGPKMVEFLANFQETVTMIEELENRYFNQSQLSTHSVMHVFQIRVGRQYRKNGIAKALILRAITHARERGFQQIIADCTGPGSRRAFEKCGFGLKGFSPYEKFSMNGIYFFAGLEGGISLMVRDV